MALRLLPLLWLLTLPMCTEESRDAESRPPSSLVPRPNAESWATEGRELVLQRARTAPPARVVLVGDSITQGLRGKRMFVVDHEQRLAQPESD